MTRPRRAAATKALAKVSSQHSGDGEAIEGNSSESIATPELGHSDDESNVNSSASNEPETKSPASKKSASRKGGDNYSSKPAMRRRGKPTKRFLSCLSSGLKDLASWREEATGNKWLRIADRVEHPTYELSVSPCKKIGRLPSTPNGMMKWTIKLGRESK